MSDGKILIRNKVNYVRLLEMNTSKVGKIEIDLPKQTLEFKVNKKMLPLFKEASKEIIPIHLQKEG